MKTDKNKDFEVAAYYFPNYHIDPHNEKWHGKGWSEWCLMQCSIPRFKGHKQPRVPLWGFEDESEPPVMRKKIETARQYGLSAFIFDWYWYEEGKFLHKALEDGFFFANRGVNFPFAIMWANHDWTNIFPKKLHTPGNMLFRGQISAEQAYKAFNYIVERYFSRDDYWKVNGGFYFSIYELATFIRTFGGMEQTREAIACFRQKAEKYGKIHLNCIYYETPLLQGEKVYENFNDAVVYLGFDSITSYTWLHHHSTDKLFFDYEELTEQSLNDFDAFRKKFTLPYFPNVTVGWDSSPRTVQSDIYGNYEEYPFCSIIEGNSPKSFENALQKTKEHFGLSTPKILTINAWNEWSEGSYLEPDTQNGFAYLEAIKKIFK